MFAKSDSKILIRNLRRKWMSGRHFIMLPQIRCRRAGILYEAHDYRAIGEIADRDNTELNLGTFKTRLVVCREALGILINASDSLQCPGTGIEELPVARHTVADCHQAHIGNKFRKRHPPAPYHKGRQP